jgi:hypothetical protein
MVHASANILSITSRARAARGGESAPEAEGSGRCLFRTRPVLGAGTAVARWPL